jgi:hypothetical protein
MATTTQRSGPRSAKATNRSRSTAAAPTPTPESTVSKLRAPAIAGGAAIAGILGGIALGVKARPRRRRLPSLDGKKTVKQVGRASKRFGELTRELRKAGEQAERIGDALS